MFDGMAFTPAHRGGSGPPLVLLHGFLDTWRTWEPVLPALERRHDVLAPTLAGHAGGPAIEGIDLAGPVERAMDAAGFETAHVAGNSLGGYVALQLAERGRARSVVAFAPAGGWAAGDESYRGLLAQQASLVRAMREGAPLAQPLLGIARADAAIPLIENALAQGWPLDPSKVTCPLRIVWGTEDPLLPWPRAAARYRDWFPHADWIELDGVGHHPQLQVPLEAAQLILGGAVDLA
jgi:pimeloyl-ACP methyl ester carboxylesterase